MEDLDSTKATPSPSLRLWVGGFVYAVFVAPLVFIVSNRVLSAPMMVFMILVDPPDWFRTYVSPVFLGIVVILSLGAVYYGWRLLAAHLRHAA